MTARRAALVVAAAVLAAGLGLAGERRESTIRIGMVRSLFRDTPEPLVVAMMAPFGALMESQTGIAGELVPGGDALNLGRLLVEDRVQLGVFHGIEFAWARQRYPELRPLMLAVNQQRHLRALVVSRKGATAKALPDFAGKALALPRQSREHCQVFVDRCCQGCGKGPADLFRPLTRPATAEDALDDVVDGTVEAAVVDGVSFDAYRRRKPGRSARLQVVEKSPTFPAAVVVYVPGALDERYLRAFHDGLIAANRSALGRQFMTLWKLTAFEPVLADYEETLSQILKAYPEPTQTSP